MKKIFITLALIIFGHILYGQNIGQLKAGYIYQFTNYVEWPGSYQSGDFVISLFGDAEVYQHLQDVANSKKVQNQKIKVNKYSSLSQIGKSHIIFISKGNSNQLSSVLNHVQGNNTLVISEKKGLAKQGSDMAFFISGGKLQFNLNKSAINKHGLKLDPRLESLASSVY